MAVAAIYCGWNGWPWWMDAGKYLRELVASRADHEAGKIERTVRDCGLMVLDDIGVREASGAAMDALLWTLNARQNLPLIVTGNLAPEKLVDVLDTRAVSRLCSGTVIEVTGQDRRLSNAMVLRA